MGEVFDVVNTKMHFMSKSYMKEWHLMTCMHTSMRVWVCFFKTEILHTLPVTNFWVQMIHCVSFMAISLEIHLAKQKEIIFLLISNYITLVKIFPFCSLKATGLYAFRWNLLTILRKWVMFRVKRQMSGRMKDKIKYLHPSRTSSSIFSYLLFLEKFEIV